MAGVLPASTIMARWIQAQEYVGGEVVGENPVAATGKTTRGHEFRYSRMGWTAPGMPGSHTDSPWGPGRQGQMVRNAPGSYLHARVCSYPMERFVEGCREYGGAA